MVNHIVGIKMYQRCLLYDQSMIKYLIFKISNTFITKDKTMQSCPMLLHAGVNPQ